MRLEHKPASSIKVGEAAARMGVTPQWVRQVLNNPDGELAGWQSRNGRWFVDENSVAAWLGEQATTSSEFNRLRSLTSGQRADPDGQVAIPDTAHDLVVAAAESRVLAAEASLRSEKAAHQATKVKLEAALRAVEKLESDLRRAAEEHQSVIAIAQVQTKEVGEALQVLALRASRDLRT